MNIYVENLCIGALVDYSVMWNYSQIADRLKKMYNFNLFYKAVQEPTENRYELQGLV